LNPSLDQVTQINVNPSARVSFLCHSERSRGIP
jgi:hypothetical protein